MAMAAGVMGALPGDVFIHMLSFLEKEQVVRSEQVCVKWKLIAEGDQVWRHLFMRMFQENLPGQKDYKKAFHERWFVELRVPEDLIQVATNFWVGSEAPKRMVVYPNSKFHPLSSFYLQYDHFPKGEEEESLIEKTYFRYTGDVFSPCGDSMGRHQGTSSLFGSEGKVDGDVHAAPDTVPEWKSELMVNGRPRNLKICNENTLKATKALAAFTLCCWAQIPNPFSGDDEAHLGFVSSFNNWEAAIELNCIGPDESGAFLFEGFVPYSTVRFVKMYKDRIVREENPERVLNQPTDLVLSLGNIPMQFQG